MGHDASRTGAPIALLRFMQWFKENAGRHFSCILQDGGELAPEFAALCPTVVLRSGVWRNRSRLRRVLRRLGLDNIGRWTHSRLIMRNQVSEPALIYCNTIAAREALEFARQPWQPGPCAMFTSFGVQLSRRGGSREHFEGALPEQPIHRLRARRCRKPRTARRVKRPHRHCSRIRPHPRR